jgi:hypothetical protein
MTDLRKYSRSTVFRLIIGGMLISLIVGMIVVWFSYGYRAAFLTLLCFIGGLSPILLILFFLKILDIIVKRN